VSPLIQLLGDGASAVQAAAETLKGIGADAVPLLREAVEHGKGERRTGAIRVLGRIGPAAELAVPDLLKALAVPEPSLQEKRQWASVGMGGPVPLDSKTCAVCQAAASALSQIGIPCVPGLMQILPNYYAEIRQLVAKALGRIGPPARDSVHALRTLTTDGNAEVRQAAAEALEKIGAIEKATANGAEGTKG
jgi:HEAT repeat protein